MCDSHRCQHQRTKKRDRADKITKKRELAFFSPPGCATGTVLHRLYDKDFARATITRDIFIPGPTRPGLCNNTQFYKHIHGTLTL